MSDKSVQTIGSEIRFSSVLEGLPQFFPIPPNIGDCTDHSAYTTLN